MTSIELLHAIEGIDRDGLDLIAWNLLSELSDGDRVAYLGDYLGDGYDGKITEEE